MAMVVKYQAWAIWVLVIAILVLSPAFSAEAPSFYPALHYFRCFGLIPVRSVN